MKFKEFKPVYSRILLYATTYQRNYVKVLGVGTKSDFEKYFDAELLTMIDNSKLQTTKVLILDDPKFKGQIIKGKGWLYDL